MSLDAVNFDCLVRAVYHESRGESSEGQVAVARVVISRKNHKAFPNTLCGVVKQRGQFPWYGRGVWKTPDQGARKAAERNALRALSASCKFDYLFFHRWRHQGRLRNITACGSDDRVWIGDHVFY